MAKAEELGPLPGVLPGSPVPLFPLPNLFLIPGALLPLHIFETRYRAMMRDLLDRDGRLALGTILDYPGHAVTDPPRVEKLGGLGEIENYQKLDDGRFVILVRGLARTVVEELPSTKPYRIARLRAATEAPVRVEEGAALAGELSAAIRHRAGSELELPDGLAVSQLADVLLMHLELPPKRMSELYSCLDVRKRAHAALAEHKKKPADTA
ncbi:MAG: LON peptidase substrate-binding domain-containing protein [Planctomycetes bacterium]|nr:LON peptidase substrate-binding domain-containing protein [Planctomycetota bacterium]